MSTIKDRERFVALFAGCLGLAMILISFIPEDKPEAPQQVIGVKVIYADELKAELCINGYEYIILQTNNRVIFGKQNDHQGYHMPCDMEE